MELISKKESERIMKDLLLVLIAGIRKRMKAQGHYHTGKLFKSLAFTIDTRTDTIIGEITFLAYGQYVETGVPAASIPFSGRRGKGGVSKYIQALRRYFQEKGFQGAEALRIAFATANVHRREGMPTRASRRFSSDEGKARTGFVGREVEEKGPLISATVGREMSEALINEVTANFDFKIGNQFVRDITI